MLLHFDGFDDYATPGATDRATVLSGEYATNGAITIRDMPELGTYCLRGGSGGSTNGHILWFFPDGDSSTRTFGFGLHLYCTAFDNRWRIVSINSAGATRRYALGITGGGALTLYSGTGSGSEIATAGGFSTGVLYHIEVKVVQHVSAGSIEVRVNGATVINATGLNTSATIGALAFLAATTAGLSITGLNIDNLYIWDNTGAVNNDWLGERLVYTLMPDGDGPTQDWALSTGSDTYALLDNIPSDPDTEYIESSSVDDIAQVTLSDLPSVDILPIAVKTHFRGMKTGTSTIEVGVAPEGETPTPHPMTQDQSLYFGTIYELNPDTGQEWTPSEINGLTLDIKRVI